MTSNRTTLAGIIALLTALGVILTEVGKFFGWVEGPVDGTLLTGAVSQLIAAVGLIFARDNAVSDQEAGLRPDVKPAAQVGGPPLSSDNQPPRGL